MIFNKGVKMCKETFETINKELLLLSKKYYGCCEIEEFISRHSCDISDDFLGFLDFYYHVSKFITKDSILVDFGCGTGLQHLFFRDFFGYIGIDSGNWERPINNGDDKKNYCFFNIDITNFIWSVMDRRHMARSLVDMLFRETNNNRYRIENNSNKEMDLSDVLKIESVERKKIVALCNKVPDSVSRIDINRNFLNVINYY